MSEAWTCADVGSFAWLTCTKRWPTIVDELRADVPEFDRLLQQLRDEIRSGTVQPLGDDVDEAPRWAAVRAFVGKPWTALPWYLGESFLYARIRAAVRYQHTGACPFLPIKLRQEHALPRFNDNDNLDDALWRSLWGNRADLSLPSAMKHAGSDDADLVADQRDDARTLLEMAHSVGILLDNAGVELACDLDLARLLHGRGKSVTLFCKDAPFFVSDALVADVLRTLKLLSIDNTFDLVDHPFFTGPGFLKTSALPKPLLQRLAACDVVIAKGDCNYRRLVGDIPPSDQPFGDVVSFPTALIALRTCKAEVLVGAEARRTQAAAQRDPDWLVSGRYGLVQVATRAASERGAAAKLHSGVDDMTG